MTIGCVASVAAMSRWALILMSNAVPTAMMAIYFFLFGIGEELFVAIVALGIFSPIALGIYDSIQKDVPEELIYTTYTLGSSHFEAVYEAVFKQIFPRIMLLIQAQIGPALVYLIAVEWIMADKGFGYHLRIQLRLLNMSQVYEYILILAGAGFNLNWLFTQARRRLAPWFGD
jgi:NitT/TauT family transport system permease protein